MFRKISAALFSLKKKDVIQCSETNRWFWRHANVGAPTFHVHWDFYSASAAIPMRLIGSGSFGQVFEIHRDGRQFALKQQRNAECLGEWHALAHVLEELDILLKLQGGHPNVLSLLSYSLDGPHTQFVFALYSCCLRTFIYTSDPKFAPAIGGNRDCQMHALAGDLASALQFVHSQRIWHRDIKPANCLVRTQTLQGVLADFGAACDRGSHQRSDIVTTLWYRPPEVLLGACAWTCAADCWSLGCTFWEMLAGEPAFREASEIGMLFQIFQKFGTPGPSWASCLARLPEFRATVFPSWPPPRDVCLHAAVGASPFPRSPPSCLRRCSCQMLALSPRGRMTAEVAQRKLNACRPSTL